MYITWAVDLIAASYFQYFQTIGQSLAKDFERCVCYLYVVCIILFFTNSHIYMYKTSRLNVLPFDNNQSLDSLGETIWVLLARQNFCQLASCNCAIRELRCSDSG